MSNSKYKPKQMNKYKGINKINQINQINKITINIKN